MIKRFTIPGDRFVVKKGVYTCTNAPSDEGGIVSIKLDTNKCLYTISIKNASIGEYDLVDFDLLPLGCSLCGYAQIDLGAKNFFTYDELTQQNNLGAWWNYDSLYSYNWDGDKDSGTTAFSIAVDDSTEWINGHDCVIVTTSSGAQDISISSYTDDTGTHGVEWGSFTDLGGFHFSFDHDLDLYPLLMRTGQTYTSAGAFTGEFDFNNPNVEISDFTGKVSNSWKVLSREAVTVPSGTFNAVKSQQTLAFTGQMHVLIDYYDDWYEEYVYYNGTMKMTITGKVTNWSDPDVGIVKTDQTMTIKISAPRLGSSTITSRAIASLTDSNRLP